MADSPPRGRRGRPKTFDREHVIDVALDRYWRQGPDAVSLNALCRQAGVSKPGLYREFGGEDGLMDAVLERYFEAVLRPTLAMTQAERPFAEVLDELVAFTTHRDAALPAGCLLTKTRLSVAPVGDATQARVDAVRQQLLEIYAAWVERAQARGEVAAAVPIAEAAAFIDSQMSLVAMQVVAGDDPDALREQARWAFSGWTALRPAWGAGP